MDWDQLKENWEIVLAVLGFLATLFLETNRMIRRQRFWSRLSFAGVLFYGGLILGIAGVVFAGSRMYHKWYYKTGPAPYSSIEAAAGDGCVVIQSFGGIMDGQENWEDFLRYEREGIPAAVRIAIHDTGAIQVVNDLFYDGQHYHYTRNTNYIHQSSETIIYPYLLYLIYEPAPKEDKNYTRREYWVLTENPDLNAGEMDSMEYVLDDEYSSHSLICETDWIPENKIFNPEMFFAG